MIGPPGLPKFGRRVFSFATSREHRRERRQAWKWLAGLYLAGVLAHFSHHMTFGLPASLDDVLMSAPTSLAWPADLIGTLMDLG